MLKIITISLFLNSASVLSMPFNYFGEFGLSGEHYDISRMQERIEGNTFSGERFYVKSGDKFSVQFEHFKRQSRNIEYESVKLIYEIIGYEYLTQPDQNDISQGRHLAWMGYSMNRWNVESRLSFSTDFTGFSKSIVNVKMKSFIYKGLSLSPKFEGSKGGDKNWWQMLVVGELALGYGE